MFITAKHWKQHKCLSMGEWISKLWHIHRRKNYSAIIRNRLLICEPPWMHLNSMKLQEGIHPQKVTLCLVSFRWLSQNRHRPQWRRTAQWPGEQEWGAGVTRRSTVGECPWLMGGQFCILMVAVVAQMCACVNIHRDGHESWLCTVITERYNLRI